MSKKALPKIITSLLMATTIILTISCSQSPVRNPFKNYSEPKLGHLPELTDEGMSVHPTVAWSANVLKKQERFEKLIPYVGTNTVYAADHAGFVVALSRQNGNKLWKTNTHHKFSAGPTLVDNQLLLATKDAKVVALDANSGHLLWETKVSSEVLAPPAGAHGVVLAHSIDGSVIALSAKNGEQLWQVNQSTPSLTLRYSSSPVVSGELALVGFSTGKLLALNLQGGLIEWERAISLPRGRSELQRMVDISADPIVEGDSVYVITYQGKLAAVSISTGTLLWERDISSYHNMSIDANHLYVTDNGYQLWAIDRFSGATIWKQNALTTRYITGPCVVNNHVVVADRGGYLHFLSPNDGKILGRFDAKGKYYQGPMNMGGNILVKNQSGKLAAIHLGTSKDEG